jgi:hypothetical protein
MKDIETISIGADKFRSLWGFRDIMFAVAISALIFVGCVINTAVGISLLAFAMLTYIYEIQFDINLLKYENRNKYKNNIKNK